jgi:thioester reductase-like protein
VFSRAPISDKISELYALTGADGVIHIASDVSFSTDTEKLVNDVKTATVEVMRTAASVPSIKAFVLTSSRIAVYNPVYGEDKEWSTKDFADYFYDLAKSVPADDPKKAVLTC